MPENIGSPASSCATPTVNGLHTPAANPHPIASILIPSPTKESQPRRMASATTIGTKGRKTVEPALRKICKMYLATEGLDDRVQIQWNDISLQDMTEEARADLYKAQAEKYRAEVKG